MFHSTSNLQSKTWILTGLGLVMLLAAVPALAQGQGGADKIRALPAAASPPPEAAAEEARAAEKIPEPPAKGKGKGRVLPAAASPPPEAVAAEQAAQQEVAAPPGRANAAQLVEQIRARPGGAERADAAKQGKAPGKGQSGQGQSTSNVMKTLGSFLLSDARAGETFTLDLTPQVSETSGAHSGLYSSNPYGHAYLFGAYVSYWTPQNSYVYLYPYQVAGLGHQVTNPFVNAYFNAPADGWYIVNINASLNSGSNLTIQHYEAGSYAVLEEIPPQSGWADYPTLQYLAVGYHHIYFVLPNGGYVSRISFDSYP